MSERKTYNQTFINIGNLIKEKRLRLGQECRTREGFIADRSEKFFDNKDWISVRYLTSVELGRNLVSIEKLIQLAYALEMDAEELFSEILELYRDG